MAININQEGIDLFTKAGATKEQVGARINSYRQQGLTDEQIQAKIDAKLGSLRQQYSQQPKQEPDKFQGLLSQVGQGIANIPSAVVKGISDVASKAVSGVGQFINKPVETVISTPGAIVEGLSSSLSNLGLGTANLPGTAVNALAGREVVKPTTFEDVMDLYLPKGSPQRQQADAIIEGFKKQGEQSKLGSLAGEIVPYVLGGESAALTKVIPSQAARYATIAGVGTPTTSLSERITNAGAAGAIEPVGKGISKVKKGVSALDQALRENIAGISPEAYKRISEDYLGKNTSKTSKIVVGRNPIETIFGADRIKNQLESLDKELTGHVEKNILNEALKKSLGKEKIPTKAELTKNINDTAYTTAKTIQKRVSDLKNKLGEEVGTAKKSIGEESGYLKTIKDTDIYVNPSNKIVGDLIKENANSSVRYTVSDGNVYVWDANKLLHDEVAKDLGIKSPEKTNVATSVNEISTEIKSAKALRDTFKKPDYSLDVIKKDIKGITDKYTPTELKAIKVSTLLNNIQKILDESASERLGVKGVSLESLNKVKKLIQDETNFNVSTTKEGKAFKDKLRRVIDDRITELSPELKEANANYSQLLKASDEIKGLNNDSLATKLKNENVALIEQLRNLDKSYPELKISELIDKLKEPKTELAKVNEFNSNPLLKTENLKDFMIRLNILEDILKKDNSELTVLKIDDNFISKVSEGAIMKSGLTLDELITFKELLDNNPEIANIMKEEGQNQYFKGISDLYKSLNEFQGKPVTLEGVGIPAGLGALGYYSGFGGLGAGALGLGLGRLLYSPAGQRLQLGTRGAIPKSIREASKKSVKAIEKTPFQQAVTSQLGNKDKDK